MLNPDAAVDELQTALEENPSLEAVVALQQVFAAVEDWENVVMSMELEVTMVMDKDHQAATWRKIADVYKNELVNQDKAVDAYEAALVASPNDVEAAVALSALYVSQERWKALHHSSICSRDAFRKKRILKHRRSCSTLSGEARKTC